MKVDSHHYSHDQQPRRPRKGRGQLRRDKERAAKHRAGAAQDQNAKTTSDNINETTAAVDSNDGNIGLSNTQTHASVLAPTSSNITRFLKV